MSVTVIDLDLMHHARMGLYASADALDALAARTPGDGDFGDAATVLSVIMGSQLEVGSLLAAEAGWLATAVGKCRDDAEFTDANQALGFYRLDS